MVEGGTLMCVQQNFVWLSVYRLVSCIADTFCYVCSPVCKCGKAFLFMLCDCVAECVAFCFVKLFSWPCYVCYQNSVTSLSVRHQTEFFLGCRLSINTSGFNPDIANTTFFR